MVKVTGPIAACVAGGQSRVFYVDDDGNFLHYLTNKEKGDVERIKTNTTTRRNYDDDNVRINDVDIKSFTKDIAAISFPMANKAIRSRIYYINEKGHLAELAKDGEDDWKFGTLDGMKYPAVRDSPVTACLSESSDSIKVYYYRDQTAKVQNAPWVAWYDGKSGAWNTQPVISVS